MEKADAKHYDKIDFLKGIGILMVLTGHFVEPFRHINSSFNIVFILIYSFHMPLFCFISGLLAEFRWQRIIHYGILYLAVQFFYFVFRILYLDEISLLNAPFYNIILPFWHMWYLCALTIWIISIPVIELLVPYISKMGVFGFSIFAGLISGFINILPVFTNSFKYFLWLLMRTAAFYPFFLAGFLWKKQILKIIEKNHKGKTKIVSRIGIISIMLLLSIFSSQINTESFFNYQPYVNGEYTVFERTAFYGVSALIISCLMILSFKDIKGIRILGKNTLSIYILHGFIFWILQKQGINIALLNKGSWVLISIYVFGNVILCAYLFSGQMFKNK